MADLTITAASVVKGGGAAVGSGTAGESITAGQALYVNTSDGKLYKAKADSAAHAAYAGVALHAALAGQPIQYQTGGSITIGATVAVGTIYVVSAAAAGGIAPVADLATTNLLTVIGYGASASLIAMNPIITGLALP